MYWSAKMAEKMEYCIIKSKQKLQKLNLLAISTDGLQKIVLKN